MTKTQIIGILAEKVMGWLVTTGHFCDGREWCSIHTEDDINVSGWNPFSNDSDCFMIVDKLTQSGWYIRIQNWGGEWLCEMWDTKSKRAATQIPMFTNLGARRHSIIFNSLRTVGFEVKLENISG